MILISSSSSAAAAEAEYKPSRLVQLSGMYVFICSLVNLRFFWRSECIHTLNWGLYVVHSEYVLRSSARSNSLPNCLNQTLLYAADNLLGQNINEYKQ